MTTVFWSVCGVYLKINPDHDHSTWVCWWCPSQRLSELKAETNYITAFFIMGTLTTSWYFYTEEVNLLPVTDVHKIYSDMH